MSPGYVTVHRNVDRKASYIEDISIPNDWELTEGVSLQRSVPASTPLQLARDGGDMLCDFVPNLQRVLVLSEPAARLLQSEGLVGEEIIEYLPITLLDKRGRPTRTRFFLVNPLLKVDCLDAKSSKFVKSPVGDKVLSVERLKIREDQIPSEAKLFRLGECTEVVVLRLDLVQRIQQAGLTGLVVKAQGEDIF